jgi:suppressor for copper-sensitivity B
VPGRALSRAAAFGLLASVALTLTIAAGGPGGQDQRRRAERNADGPAGMIHWVPFDRRRAEALGAGGGLVFVDVTADWCFTCKANERLTLDTPEVAGAFTRYRVVPMRADWTNQNAEIARFLADHGRYGIPFYLLYRPGGEPVVFSELPSKSEIVRAIEDSARLRASL